MWSSISNELFKVSTTPFLMFCSKGSKSKSYIDDDVAVQGYNSNLRQARQVIVRAFENFAGCMSARWDLRYILDIWVRWSGSSLLWGCNGRFRRQWNRSCVCDKDLRSHVFSKVLYWFWSEAVSHSGKRCLFLRRKSYIPFGLGSCSAVSAFEATDSVDTFPNSGQRWRYWSLYHSSTQQSNHQQREK